MEQDEYGRFQQRTTVIVTDALGGRVQVTVTAPRNGLWSPSVVRDAAEVAAHAAHQTIDHIEKLRSAEADKVPF